MMEAVDEQREIARQPKTLLVLALLMAVAMIFSWLFAYAVADALVSAELLSPWTARTDPRPRWLLGCFVALMLVFGGCATFARIVSRRQLRRIDAMADDDDDDPQA